MVRTMCWKHLNPSKAFKLHCRNCQSVAKPFFVSTPIFYVNGAPHIGHLQSCLFADALHRTQLLLGKTSILSTGTDEHGLKIQQAAKAAGKDNQLFCSEVSNKFKEIFAKADISYSHFIRTTDERHRRVVQHFWEELSNRDYIYKGKYEGWYNVSDETFVAPSQAKEIQDATGTKMVCADTGQILEKMQEDNYIFTLPKFKNDLLYWLSKDVVKPNMFAKDLERWINEGLQDLSISRQRSRLPWGIPVPGDDTQTIYVWLDALVNYLTVSGYPEKNTIWPPDCQVIGKDILKFHGIYWPAFLMASGLEPPSSIFCHSHWTVNYEKMSKSKGNVIDPGALIEQYGCDGLRYFLLRAVVPHSDTNYSEIKILRLLNVELADTLGNLLSRCCAPAVNKKQIFPPFSNVVFDTIVDDNVRELIKSASLLPSSVSAHFQECNFFHGLELIMDTLRKTNGFVQLNKPWELVKDNSAAGTTKLDTVLHIALEVLRISGILLQPIVPSMSKGLLDKLGIQERKRSWVDMECFSALNSNMDSSQENSLGENNYVLFARRKA